MPEIRAEIVAALYAAERAVPEVPKRAARIARAGLWWVTGEMSRLALSASVTLDDVDLGRDLPGPSGVMVWAHPNRGSVGLVWVMTDTHIETRWITPPDNALNAGMVTGPLVSWTPSVAATAAGEVPFGQVSKSSRDVWLLAATCLLMITPTVAATAPIERRHRAGPGLPRVPTPVQVISLRELGRRPGSGLDEAAGGRPQQQHAFRWMVSGHWRQQAYGPDRSLRRPVWVMPYIKGPDGAPVKNRVHVWRR